MLREKILKRSPLMEQKWLKNSCRHLPTTEIVLQYSPESFSDTELDFALECCEAVIEVWQPTPERKLILNLPATVEWATPNVHADQIEVDVPQGFKT